MRTSSLPTVQAVKKAAKKVVKKAAKKVVKKAAKRVVKRAGAKPAVSVTSTGLQSFSSKIFSEENWLVQVFLTRTCTEHCSTTAHLARIAASRREPGVKTLASLPNSEPMDSNGRSFRK